MSTSLPANMSPLLTPEEAADYLRSNARTLERWRVVGSGPRFCKIGRVVRYHLEDLDQFVAQQRREHTTASAAPSTILCGE